MPAAAIVTQALLDGTATARGAMTAADLVGAESLLEKIAAQGFPLTRP